MVHPWEKLYRQGKWKTIEEPLQEVVDFLPLMREYKAKKVLDLGCGTGRHTVFLARQGFLVVGLDISFTALGIAEGKLQTEGIKNAVLVQTNMNNLPFVNECFNAAISTNVIHHAKIGDVRKAVNELHRVLRKNGIGLITLVADTDYKYQKGRKLEEKTYEISEGAEKGVIHHFFSKVEAEKLFHKFELLNISSIVKESDLRRHSHWKIIFKKNQT